MGGLSVATAILLYRLIGKVFTPGIGAIAAIYWVFSTEILKRIYQQGLETGIAAFFIVLFVYKFYEFERSWRENPMIKKDLITLGIIGICVMLSRLDLVFFVGLAGIWLVFRGSSLRYLLPLDIVSIVFSVLLAFILTIALNDYYQLAHEAVKMLVVSLLIKIPLAYVFGLYQRGKFDRLPRLLRSLVLFAISSSAILSVVMIAVARILAFQNFPRMILVYDAISTFILVELPRLIFVGLKTAEYDSTEDNSPPAYLLENWRHWFQDGIVYYAVAFGGLGIYMVWNKFSFGTFSPVSGQIKRWWGSFSGHVYGGPARTELSFFGMSYGGDSNTWRPVSTWFGEWAERLQGTYMLDTWRYLIILTLFAILFYLILLINKRKAKASIAQLSVIPLLCGSWLQVFYYHVLGYSAYKEWYWISQSVLVVIVLSIMLGMLYQAVRKPQIVQSAIWVVVIVFGIYRGSAYWSVIHATMTYHEWSASDPYMEMTTFLETNTEPGSIIGMTGGGNIGYFIKDRTIVNMDGLVNSYTYFELLKNKEAGKYLADQGMNYVMANLDILDSLPYRGQYDGYMEWMDRRYGGKNLVHYHSEVQP